MSKRQILTQYICALSKPEQDKLLAKAKKNLEKLVDGEQIEEELELVRNSRICDVSELIEI